MGIIKKLTPWNNRQESGDRQQVLNLEEIIQDYTWNRYKKFLGSRGKFISCMKDYVFDFHWTALLFEHTTQMVLLNSNDTLLDLDDFGTPRPQGKKIRSDRSAGCHRNSYKAVAMDTPVILHTEQHENRSPVNQTFNFVAETEKRTSMYVEFIENYTLGNTTNIELTLPLDVCIYTGLDHKLLLTNINGQSFEEIQTWNVDTEVKTPAWHRTDASLSVYEQKLSGEFRVRTKMSLIRDKLPVMIRRKSDGDVLYTCWITSLEDVFRSHQGPNLSLQETTNRNNQISYDVVVTSRGRCETTGWTDHQILVTSEEISDFKETEASVELALQRLEQLAWRVQCS